MNETVLYKKVLGSMLGFAVGDAFGVPFEEMHFENIIKQYGGFVREMTKVNRRLLGGGSFYENHVLMPTESTLEPERPPHPFGAYSDEAGEYTDDTRYMLLCAKAVVQYGRRVTSVEFAKFISEYVENLKSTRTEDDLERRWAQDMFKFEAIATIAQHRHVFSALYEILTGWDGVAGLVNPFDTYEAGRDGGPLSCAVAEAMKPDATVDSVLKAARDAYWTIPGSICAEGVGFLQNEYIRRVDAILEYADKTMDPEAVIRFIYDRYLVTFPPYNFLFPMEMLPTAFGLFKATNGNFKETIIWCGNFGRDGDGIAAMGGALAGTLYGVDVIPPDWKQMVLKHDRYDIMGTAEKLTKVVSDKLEAICIHAQYCNKLK